MHGFITAAAYGVPAIMIATGKKKFDGLVQLLGTPDILVETWDGLCEKFSDRKSRLSVHFGEVQKIASNRLNKHWSVIEKELANSCVHGQLSQLRVAEARTRVLDALSRHRQFRNNEQNEILRRTVQPRLPASKTSVETDHKPLSVDGQFFESSSTKLAGGNLEKISTKISGLDVKKSVLNERSMIAQSETGAFAVHRQEFGNEIELFPESLQNELESLSNNLIDARSKPLKSLKRKYISKALFKLAGMERTFSIKRREKFLRSARKRDPRRDDTAKLRLYLQDAMPIISAEKPGPSAAREYSASDIELAKLLDCSWYTSKHNLEDPSAAVEHFLGFGLSNGYAPDPSFASADGRTLSHWGAEFLFRWGAKIGQRGSTPLLPDSTQALNPFSIENKSGKRIAVVSAIFGGFDRLLPVDSSWSSDVDFYLFSDCNFEILGEWQLVHANYDNPDPRRRARFVKTHLPTYLSMYDWVFWVDGNVLVCSNPAELVEILEEEEVDFASFQHPDRLNVRAEAAACLRFNKEDVGTLGRHMIENSARVGFDKPLLFETMVCAMRPKRAEVQQMCALWWAGIMTGSKRDQLSLPLAVIDTPNLRHGFLPGSIRKSLWFANTGHEK